MMKRLLIFGAGLLFAALATAQQYKWVDKNGRTQYGDTPPAGVKATPLRPPPAPLASPSAAPAGKKDDKPLTPEQAFQKRQKEQAQAEEKAQKAGADVELKRTNCESAQSQLRGLQSGERMSSTSASGERVYMDDAQRARETERAQKAVAEWCK